MKSIYMLILSVFAVTLSVSAQTTYTITNSGFTYTPDSVAAHVGDQVTFNMDFSTHPLHEVSSATWTANGSTQLAGGFSATSGTTATFTMTQAGTRYYVCANHVSFGMKGRIFVSNPNGVQSIASVAAATYPNPATNLLHIVTNATGGIHCVMTNMLGQLVLQEDKSISGQGIATLDISGIPEGCYILTSTSGDGNVRISKVQVSR